MACAFLYATLLLAVAARGLVSPGSLDSDISIIIHNDLLESFSPHGGSGVLLLDAMPLQEAMNSCNSLGESLWKSTAGFFSITNDLGYLVSQKRYADDQRYWIAPVQGTPSTVDEGGRVKKAPANEHFPVLCTQTAPYSTPDKIDTNTTWQVTINSNNQHLTGVRDRFSFRFLGIRYAEAPKRWAYSKGFEGNGDYVSALDYGSQCVQWASGSEDCFFLNVWTPYLPNPKADCGKKLKPVMFWIHGGAFISGTGSDTTFDGANLASRGDVVVVTINYRLGTFGFLALDDGKTKGNYGLADQITALDWVRRNIKDFGGDPNQITIFGQSAGAGSVRALLASPKARGKFAGAIMQSNLGGVTGTTYSKYYTIEQEMEVAGNAILSETNCTYAASQLECLRAVPATTISTLGDTARYLVVDGEYLTSLELNLKDSRSTASVPLMLGTTRDDGAAMIGYPRAGESISQFLSETGLPPTVAPSQVFPIHSGSNQTLDMFNTTARVATDGGFRCIDQATAYAGFTNKIFPEIYFYEFNRTYQLSGWSPNPPLCQPPVTSAYPNGDPNGEYFKCHSGELYYVFGNVVREGLALRDEYDLPFQQFVLDSWASFARTFKPTPDVRYTTARGYVNTTRQVEIAGQWTPFKHNNYRLQRLQWPSAMADLDEIEQCRALDLPLEYLD